MGGGIGRRVCAAVVGLVVLVGAAGAGAQDVWRENGLPAAKGPAMAARGGFAVMQVASNDPEGLMADWNRPGAGVNMRSATTTVRHKPLVTFIVFRGCKGDASGLCNVTADFETTTPQGKLYDSTKGARIWVGHAPPVGYSLELSEAAYGMVFEDKDALGVYRVTATITDHVAGVTLKTYQDLTATAR